MIRRPLLVPLATTLAAALLTARVTWDSDTFQNCRYLGPSPRLCITSWAGLTCAVGAVLLFATLPRSERRGVAAVSAVAAVLLGALLLASVYWLYTPDPSGGDDCSGLHLLVP
ncbi:hypothetical protein [Streptomyces sp. NPDC007205]|uniref:hypothetical protein n=1 Tax=Streptomyces sp. NPDC007205 TaxID=3154316 RepID=UPI0033D40971